MSLHANAVAQNRAARKWTCRIHREHPHVLLCPPVVRSQAIHERAFPSARRAGDSRQISLSSVRENAAEDFFRFVLMVFNGGDGAGNGADVAREDLLDPGVN